jgi:hypothetical protein
LSFEISAAPIPERISEVRIRKQRLATMSLNLVDVQDMGLSHQWRLTKREVFPSVTHGILVPVAIHRSATTHDGSLRSYEKEDQEHEVTISELG